MYHAMHLINFPFKAFTKLIYNLHDAFFIDLIWFDLFINVSTFISVIYIIIGFLNGNAWKQGEKKTGIERPN
jgi:hypothetical protein